MVASLCQTAFALLLLAPVGPAVEEKDVPDEVHEARVALRLNAIKTKKLTEQYEQLAEREPGLMGAIRVCAKSGDPRLPDYQAALTDVQNDLVTTKQQLIAQEKERTLLVQRLKKHHFLDEAPAPVEPANRLLEKILERLNSIDKRLEKLERQR